jgi:RHS repeat-associated protein
MKSLSQIVAIAGLVIALIFPLSRGQAQQFLVHTQHLAIPSDNNFPIVQAHHLSARPTPYVPQHALRGTNAGVQSVGCASGSDQPAIIVALASALKCDPFLVFEYVYDNIEFEPLYGSHKGALGTLLDERGDDADQALLLVALWNAAGYSQTGFFDYGYGESSGIPLSNEQLASYLAVPDDVTAIENLLNFAGIPYSVNKDGTLNVSHFFAAVQLGGTWYFFDPSFKSHNESTGLNVASLLGYNQSQFLSDVGGTIDSLSISNVNRANLRADLTAYANNLINYITENGDAFSVGDIIGGRSIAPPSDIVFHDLPGITPSPTFPGNSGNCPNQTSTVECRTYVEITMPGATAGQAIKLYTDQIYGHRITVFSIPSGSNFIPTLLIDGAAPSCVPTCANTGTAEPAGQIWSIATEVVEPNQPSGSNCTAGITTCYTLTIGAGGNYLISLGAGQVGRGMAEYHRQLLAQARATGNADSSELVLGENLAVISYNWLGEYSAEQQITDQLAQTTTLYHYGLGITGQAEIQQTYQGPYIDLPVNALSIVPWASGGETTTIGNYSYSTALVSTAFADSEALSAFESAVLEQTQAPLAGATAASTMKLVDDNMNPSYPGALQKAFLADGTTSEHQQEFNTDIYPVICPTQNPLYFSSDCTDIYEAVNNTETPAPGPQLVLIPENGMLPVDQWKGAGYMAILPTADYLAISQRITGGMFGGFLGTPDPNPAPNTQVMLQPPANSDTVPSLLDDIAGPSNEQVAEPIDGVTGAFIYQHNDLVSGGGRFPYALSFSRTYLSSSGSYLTTTTADNGIGNGWSSNFSTNAQVESDPFIGIGSDRSGATTIGAIGSPAISAAAAIAALYVMQDLAPGTPSAQTPTAQTLTISSMVARWFADQLTGNAVMVNWPNTTEEFIALPHADGSTVTSYNAPPNSSARLTQTGTGEFTYLGKDGVAVNFGGPGIPAGAMNDWVYPNGMTVNLTYSGTQLDEISNNVGRRLFLSYVGPDISNVTDDAGRSVAYNYDANHNLAGFTDPLGNATIFSYDTFGVYDTLAHLTQIFYPSDNAGAYVTNWYDSLGRVVQQANANGYTSNLYFAGPRTETVDAAGDRRVTYQTDRGSIVMAADVLNNEIGNIYLFTPQQNGIVNVTTNQYDGLDRLTLTTLPEGGTTAYSYATAVNPWANNIASITRTEKPGSPLSPLTTNFTYDSNWNKLNGVTDPLGLVTTMNYDPETGNLLSTVADAGSSAHFNVTRHFTYDGYGRVLTATDPLGVETVFAYDSFENLITQVADSGTGRLNATTQYSYDAVGNRTSRTDPNGNTTTTSYDADRRLLATTAPAPFNNAPSLVRTANAYDADGHLLTVTRSNGGSNVVTSYTYTPTGKVLTTTDPNGNVTRNSYDTDDRLASVTDPAGRTTSYAYDAMSRRVSATNAAIQSTPLVQFAYTPDGLLGSLTDANNNATSFTPDGFDRLSTTTWPDSSTETLSYDADSNVLTRKTRAGQTLTFTHDTLNRLSTKAAPGEATVTYAYDLDSHVTGTSDTSASIVKPSTAASYSTGMTYDQLNRPVGVNWSPAPSQAAPTASSVTFGYGYDATNRRVSQSATDKSWWNYPTAASSVAYTPNNLNQYGKVGSVTPTYDGNGDLTYDGSYTYCYDAESRLTGILSSGTCASPGTTVAAYAYDAQGRRKSKIVGSTTTIYVTDTDNREVLEYNGSSGALGTWYGDAPAAAFGPDAVLNQMTIGGSRQTLIPDVQGSIAATLDSGSGALTKLGYQTFGEHPSLAAGSYRYTARRYDAETAGSTAQPSGLYYYRARMYSPTWGRFLQPDPIGYRAGTNLYAYVNNDPLNLLDPYGFAADSPQSALAGFENYLSESAEALSEIPSDLAAMTPADVLGNTQSALLAIGVPTPAIGVGEAAEVLGAEVAEEGVGGTATIYQYADPLHYSVEVQAGEQALHTELLGGAGDITSVGIRNSSVGAVQTFTVDLPNAQGALNYSSDLIGQTVGPYSKLENSCLSYCGNVLNAGGLEVPLNSSLGTMRYLNSVGGP